MRKLTSGEMVSLPWRWHGPTLRRDEHGNEWFEIRIEELSDFFVAAATHQAAIIEAGPALQAYLASYVEREELPPLPAAIRTWQDVPPGFDKVRLRALQVA